MFSKQQRLEYDKKRAKAVSLVTKAIKEARLIKPDTCELCGSDKGLIVGHHWNGYDNPLDVWFICFNCNSKLRGPNFHDGSVSKDEALAYIHNPKAAMVKTQEHRCKQPKCNNWTMWGDEYCYRHKAEINQEK